MKAVCARGFFAALRMTVLVFSFIFLSTCSSRTLETPVISEETLSHWDEGTFQTVYDSVIYHWQKHAEPLGKTPVEYTNDALRLVRQYQTGRRALKLKNGKQGFVIRTRPGGPGGYFTEDERIVSFWYSYTRKRR